MKKCIALSIFLLSFHTSLSAMMLNPVVEQERKNHKRQRAQERTDNIVCPTAKYVCKKINKDKNWTYPPAGKKIYIESPYWEAKWIISTVMISGEIKKSKCPTLILKTSPDQIIEAMDDLINKPALLECTIARNTAQIFCMKNIMGSLAFKKYATHFYKMLGETEGWSTDQFFHELPEQFLTKVNGKERPGSMAYITNLPCYGRFKPNGNGRGSNVFCVGDNKYVGFSGIYKNGPQSLEVIEAQDFEFLCDTQDVERDHEEHSNICKPLIENKGLFELFRREEQEKNCNFHWIFDAEKFKNYKQTGGIDL